MSLRAGDRLGTYEITGELGAGGMGIVLRARDTKLDREVALKVLPPRLQDDAEARQRFVREARSAAAIDHPFVCHVHEAGEVDGVAFIAMERVEGQTLEARLGQGRVEVTQAVHIATEIVEALEAAHEKEIVHRDLKPSNVMLTPGGHVKVTDFGLAKRVPVDEGSQVETRSALTRIGSTLGTIPYMSPEQLRGDVLDTRTDLFSLGIVLYELFTGSHPFMKSTEVDTSRAILTETPAPLAARMPGARPSVVSALQTLVDGLLQVDREQRTRSATTVRQAIGAVSAEVAAGVRRRDPAAGPLRRPALIVAALLAGAVALTMVLWIPYQSGVAADRARALIPEIEQLATDGRYAEAYELVMRVQERLPDDATVRVLLSEVSDSLTVTTDPAGATVSLQRLATALGESFERAPVGTTPIRDLELPRAEYLATIEMDGRATIERVVSSALSRSEGRFGVAPDVVLEETMVAPADIPAGMVRVAGAGAFSLRGDNLGGLGDIDIDDFFIDRHEVNNAQFQEFIRAGGYATAEFWTHVFVRDGIEMSSAGAMALFVDRSGLPGPRAWSDQEFPEGRAQHPVTGISWYEAAAYAEYAGKTLPTLHQWFRAARGDQESHFEGIVMPWGLMHVQATEEQRANFYGRDTVRVDAHPFGISPYGVYNMAGNVEEWTLNERGAGRATAGGSWADAAYVFQSGSSRPAFDAVSTVGFRGVSKPRPGAGDQGAGRVEPEFGHGDITPVDDATFQGFLSHHRYDRTSAAADVLETVETPDWTREKIRFPGVSDDPILAYLYLPKRGASPFQCINYVVSSTVFFGRTAAEEVEALLSSQIKAGRAVLAVVPKGALEREWPGHSDFPRGRWATVEARDESLLRVIEYRMGLDYLENRPEIDNARIAHIGFSWGAGGDALLLNAVDERLRAAIFIGGYLRPLPLLPEVNPVNFVSRIPHPTLSLRGNYDEEAPWEPLGRALSEWLPPSARLELVESGHLPPVELRNPIIEGFLDKTLGPVASP